jgi:molybdopterin biosynthesis enzyme
MSPFTERAQRIARLTPLREIFLQLDALAKPVAAREVDLASAVGRVLAADVRSPAPWPPKPVALRDGWAVRAELVADAGPYAPVSLSEPAWVETGAFMPADTDAVLPPDAVTMNAGYAEANAAAVPGEGVQSAAADAPADSVLRSAGERLRHTDVAILCAVGFSGAHVRVPRVRVALARAIAESKDMVSSFVCGCIEAAGATAIFDRTMPLERALTDGADAVIGIGGTGMGRSDASVQTLARFGRVALHGMAIAPGDTAALGDVDGRPVLLLPGCFDAALAAFLLVGRPLLARLAGAGDDESTSLVTLKRKISSPIGLAAVVPVRRIDGGCEPLPSSPISWHALIRADGWVLVPAESEGFPAGATVEMRVLP